MIIENLSNLKFNIMSNKKFDEKQENNLLQENEIYLTPAPEVDSEPIENSKNLITSGGVFEALQTDGGGVREWEDIQNKPGDVVTTTIEINSSYTTTLGTPNNTPPASPFLIWNNVVKDKQIYDNIQDDTPVKVSYIENDETVEIGTYNLFSNSTLDTQFGMGSNNTGYYGFVNAAQSLEEVLTQGVWTRADSTKPTFTLVFAKSNTTSQSWLTIAAPESLTDITFIIEISTTGTETKTIKLSNEAINVDEVPTEGSTNFLTSGAIKSALIDSGLAIPDNVSYFINDIGYQTESDVNEAIQNAKNEINETHYFKSEIETMLSNKQSLLNFDTEPLENSVNPVTSKGIYKAIVNVIEIAEGKRKSYVFDNVAALDLWLDISTNTELLQVGDVFLLRSTTEPDYWWDGSTKQILDTNMDLNGYATIEYVDDKLGDVDAAITQIEALVGGASI